MSADTAGPQSIPNTGLQTPVTFNDGVVTGGAGSVTLSLDQTAINMVHAGIYAISVAFAFDSTDPTGTRGCQINTAGNGAVGSLDRPNNDGSIMGAETFAGGAESSVQWTGPFAANSVVNFDALVKGAAGAVDLAYMQVTVCMVAPLGT